MMKTKLLVSSLIAAMVLGLTGCSGGISQAEYDELKADYEAVVAERDALLAEKDSQSVNAPVATASPEPTTAPLPNQTPAVDPTPVTPTPAPLGVFDESTVLSQIEVKEYSYSSRYHNYAFLVLKNNSEFNIRISANVDFYNDKDELIGSKSSSESAFESGTEMILFFMPDEKFARMKNELSAEIEDWYECVVSDLSYEYTEAKNKIILSVTNNGAESAEFVQGSVLFFNNGEVVGFSWNYFTDNDSEIKPGKTIKREMDCREKFDDVKVFLTGRRR